MDISFILLIALICIAIGFLVGRLVHVLKEQGDSAKAFPGKGVKFWYEPESDRLMMEIDGHAYRHGKALSIQQRRHVQRALFHLNNWLMPDTPGGIASDPQPRPKEQVVQPVVPTIPEQPSRRFSPVGKHVDAFQLPTESMIAQIDHILQGKLVAAGLQDKAVRLMEIPGKGMVVMIGLESYHEVADIPDGEIKSLLREAVREWEQQDTQHGV